MRRFADIMGDLGGALGKMPQQARLAVLKELFGKIGIAGGAALQEFGKTGELAKFSEAMKKVDGTAGRMAKTMNMGAAGSMKSLMSALEGLAIAIADSGLLKWFTDIVQKITGWVRRLTESNPKILKWGSIIALVAAGIGPLLVVLGSLIAMVPAIISGAGAIGAAPDRGQGAAAGAGRDVPDRGLSRCRS
jgi:TP901 family phage tail tape measure protein